MTVRMLRLAVAHRYARRLAPRRRSRAATPPLLRTAESFEPTALTAAIAQLPAVEQQVLFLRLHKGRSSADTARALGCDGPTLRHLQGEALRRLHAVLNSPSPPPPTTD